MLSGHYANLGLIFCSADSHVKTAKELDARWERNFNRTELRHALKSEAVRQLGGACRLCGYDRCLAALEFHHLDPDAKDFSISEALSCGMSSLEINRELSRCVLLCSCCHREVHTGLHPQLLPKESDAADAWDPV